jgi:hypothetical protein
LTQSGPIYSRWLQTPTALDDASEFFAGIDLPNRSDPMEGGVWLDQDHVRAHVRTHLGQRSLWRDFGGEPDIQWLDVTAAAVGVQTVFGLVRERFGGPAAIPQFILAQLTKPGVSVKSARFVTPDSYVLERYRRQAAFAERADTLEVTGSESLEGVTLGLGDVSANVFADGQIYLHNVTPDDLAVVMSILAPRIWPAPG